MATLNERESSGTFREWEWFTWPTGRPFNCSERTQEVEMVPSGVCCEASNSDQKNNTIIEQNKTDLQSGNCVSANIAGVLKVFCLNAKR